MLYFLTEHTLIIYVQYIKGSKRKTPYILEKLPEKDFVHFVSDSIFRRLKFDYSSSEMVSNQKIKNKIVFSWWLRISGDQTNPWKSIITKYNEKQMSNGIFKFVQINMKHLL